MFSALTQTIVQAFAGIPPEISTMLIAAIPITEMRASIPLAITHYHLSPLSAAAWSIIGSMIPTYLLLHFLDPVSEWLSNHSTWFHKFFTWLFEHTRKRLENQVGKYGALALTIFVAITVPPTGVWSAAAAAFIFGVSKKKSFLAILVGVVISAIVMLLVTLGTTSTVNWLRQ